MILVDTSVWIDHLRGRARAAEIATLLDDNLVLLHPWVLGELFLGGLGRRADAIVADLLTLPAAPLVPDTEVLQMVGQHAIAGSGVGWIDAQLLASARVASAHLWTHDGRLAAIWAKLAPGA
ncbi:MAG: PIN domain-containing protein [Planctomycetes bacterium]|nr:PIN domain-containing protein [Planctomycetota bacterium]